MQAHADHARGLVSRYIPSPLRPAARSFREEVQSFLATFEWEKSSFEYALQRARSNLQSSNSGLTRDDLIPLQAHWGNQRWAASPEYLLAVQKAFLELHPQRILECGSGLSTIILALLVHRYGGEVVTLEHNTMWAHRVEKLLARLGLAHVHVVSAPLENYGDYTWYNSHVVPEGKFDFVVCDGPPSRTRGGRYGVLPFLARRESSGTLLLDDANRSGEKEILRRWAANFLVKSKVDEAGRGFAELRFGNTCRDIVNVEVP